MKYLLKVVNHETKKVRVITGTNIDFLNKLIEKYKVDANNKIVLKEFEFKSKHIDSMRDGMYESYYDCGYTKDSSMLLL